MAELLVKAVDSEGSSDPEKIQRGGYRRGMPVVVMDDGHKWGREEGPPKFVVLKFPGIPKEKMAEYLTPNLLDESDPTSQVGRRLWKFDLDALPRESLDALRADGAIVVKAVDAHEGRADAEWSDVRACLKNAQTGEAETKELDEARAAAVAESESLRG